MVETVQIDHDRARFHSLCDKHFEFLLAEYEMTSKCWVISRSSPRDMAFVVRYTGHVSALDIVWGPGDASLGILVRKKTSDGNVVSKNTADWVYFEPYLDFVTGGAVKPIVPPSYPRDSVVKVAKAFEARSKLLSASFEQVLSSLADRVKQFGGDMIRGDNSQFVAFHAFFSRHKG